MILWLGTSFRWFVSVVFPSQMQQLLLSRQPKNVLKHESLSRRKKTVDLQCPIKCLCLIIIITIVTGSGSITAVFQQMSQKLSALILGHQQTLSDMTTVCVLHHMAESQHHSCASLFSLLTSLWRASFVMRLLLVLSGSFKYSIGTE